MQMIPVLLREMQEEAQTTRKMLTRVPLDKYDWKPHEKSMSLGRLAAHVAELPGWVSMALNTSELDFAKSGYNTMVAKSTEELMDYYEKNLAEGLQSLQKASEAQLEDMWTLRDGPTVYSTRSKLDVIRMSYCQTVHHRAQLGVYLRLLDVAIPGSYGPSADEH
ncbi:DinB family protein [Chitinophaga vietnamensis]|uniref:DinB family protein n=1 Tax=Chitinophaga vietnamensis TaxID=2593957 RepID=UPI0011789CC3|nr:DinB family protein [Chitinophaga vietnamensis]